MKRMFNKALLSLLGGSVMLFSCQKEIVTSQQQNIDLPTSSKIVPEEKTNTFKGPQVQMGNGLARSYITISRAGVPQELGIELTATALKGLTPDPNDFEHAMFVLPLHQKAKDVTPFDHIVVNWEPQGHEPDFAFGVPHFDFHFYRISLAEQLAIPPYEVDPTGFDNNPPVGYIPNKFIDVGANVPMMGKHWIDLTAPEFTGGSFTKTFIYGSYNGVVAFLEPMITMDYLNNISSSVSTPFDQPTYFSPTGTYYPTQYNIYKENTPEEKYKISLSGFELH